MTVWTVVAEPSAWKFGWEALVAIGTLVLAFGTGALAWSTRNLAKKTAEEVQHSKRQVDAALAQVEVAQQQAATAQDALDAAHEQTRLAQLTLNAQIRPVLIDPPSHVGGIPDPVRFPGRDKDFQADRGFAVVTAHQTEVLISVPFRNGGTGLAMSLDLGLVLHIDIGQPARRIDPPNVPPGDYGRVSFRAVPGDAAFAPLSQTIDEGTDFLVDVLYSDVAGGQRAVSRFDLYRPPGSARWVVRSVRVMEANTDEPS